MTSFILAAISAAVAIGYFLLTEKVPSFSLGDPLGPRTFPFALAGSLALCALLLIGEGIRDRMKPAGERQSITAALPRQTLLIFLGVAGAIALYFLLFRPLGFVVDTALFLFIAMALTNRGKWVTNTIVALAIPVVFYAVLGGIFRVPLPRGILTFW